MLTRNHRQEVLSRAYIQIVAGLCGMSCGFRDFDYGWDVTLHEILRRGRRRYESGYKVDLQAKSTSVPRWSAADLLFDLPVANYDDLREPSVGCDRLLVVLVLPRDETDWVTQLDSHLLLRHAAYWRSLRGRPATSNKKTVQVNIPRANLFTPAALTSLIERMKRGEAV